MRLEGQSQMGYYPTPDVTLQHIPTWLTVAPDGELRRYLDPCCGKGEALALIANGHGDTYGIELSDARAQAAEDKLGHVINTAYEYVRLTEETFSFVLLNPPYDGESTTGGGKRMEETFLVDRDTTDLLVPGGVLCYIIPHSRINEAIARHLAGWYSELRCFKLPSEEYEVFKQVVIFGLRRAEYSTPKGETLSDVLAWRNGQRLDGFDETEVPATDENGQPVLGKDGNPKIAKKKTPRFVSFSELTPGSGEYTIPPSPLKGKRGEAFKWQYLAVSDADFLREAEHCAARLETGRVWRDLIPATEPPPITPAITPKKGHIAMLINGGLLGTNHLRTPDGDLLLKGNVAKYTVTKHDVLVDDEGDETGIVKEETEERFKSQLSVLDADGELAVTENTSEIGALLEKHVGQLAEIVQARNVPQYDMHPHAWEWAVFEPLSRGRKLPGRGNETGLTDMQKHLTIALGRLALKHGSAIANAEMGSGKTTCGIAAAEYIETTQQKAGRPGAYPALVVGPGIVTSKENWPKEIPEVTPGAQSRVITVGAKPLPKPMKIGQWVKSLNVLLDEDVFEGKNGLIG